MLNIEVASFQESPIYDYDITLLPAEAGFDAEVIGRKFPSIAVDQAAGYLSRSELIRVLRP